METIAGFWGGYFGTVALMLAGLGVCLAWLRSRGHQRYLRRRPGPVQSAWPALAAHGRRRHPDRVLAHVVLSRRPAGLHAAVHAGPPAPPQRGPSCAGGYLPGPGGTGTGLGAGDTPGAGVQLGGGPACWAWWRWRGRALRAATGSPGAAVSSVFFMLLALCGLSWIAVAGGQVHWTLHALNAVSAMAYLRDCGGAGGAIRTSSSCAR